MEDANIFEHGERETSRIIRVGQYLSQVFRDARQQLRIADLNPHEGRLRSSIAPSEYLPGVPDHIPFHDDTL